MKGSFRSGTSNIVGRSDGAITLAANEVTLVMFMVCFEALKRRRGSYQAVRRSIMKHHAHQ